MQKKRSLKQIFTGLTFNLTAAIVVVLLVLCIVACVIGYYRFTDSLTSQYNDAAYHTALTSAAVIDADRIDDYLAHNGEDPDYQITLSRLNLLADKQNTSVIYVIRPNEDYTSYLSVFNSPSSDSGYTPWAINSPHDTANQTYIDYYRAMCENGLQSATVVRDHDLKGAQPHITVMIPLTRSDGTVKDILCVQRFMEELKAGRQKYTVQVFSVVLALTLILAVAAAISSRTNFVRPIHKIIAETNRFASGGSADDSTLKGKVSGIFEITYLAKEVDDMERQIAEYTESLTKAAAEKERVKTELNVATQIQQGVIPTVFPTDPRFDLYAMMKPAKEVGGDFYNFFMIDDDHLGLVVGDVSGKGVPAALFMMVVSILTKERSMMGGDPQEILTFVNNRICQNNPADMFVTMWLGILELSTGKLTSVNAGHDDPAYRPCDGDFSVTKEKHGVVVGAMDTVRYKQSSIVMRKRDKIIVYTDGLPEATDGDNNMFRIERAVESFNRRKDMAPQAILQGTWQDVCAFVGDAPQFDDYTTLCLQYNGPAPARLEIDATDNNLDAATDFVDQRLTSFDKKTRNQMRLAVEEIFVNVAHYAYGDTTGKITITVTDDERGVSIEFADSGTPYDPLEKPDPDVTLSADDRPIGGLGIFLVKKIADRTSYKYVDGKNVFTIEKDKS